MTDLTEQQVRDAARDAALEEAAIVALRDADWTAFKRRKQPHPLTGEEQNVFAIDPDEDMSPTQAKIAAYVLGLAAGEVIAATIRSLKSKASP